jgi:hypothetical protein
MFLKALLFTSLVAFAIGQDDIDALINSIFTKPPEETGVTPAPAPFPTLPTPNNKPNPAPAEGPNQVIRDSHGTRV